MDDEFMIGKMIYESTTWTGSIEHMAVIRPRPSHVASPAVSMRGGINLPDGDVGNCLPGSPLCWIFPAGEGELKSTAAHSSTDECRGHCSPRLGTQWPCEPCNSRHPIASPTTLLAVSS